MFDCPAARKICKMLQYFKGAISRSARRPSPPPARSPQVSRPIATFDFSLQVPPMPQAPPQLPPLPSVNRLKNRASFQGVDKVEDNIVRMIETSSDDADGLSPEEELTVYREYLRLLGLRGSTDANVNGYCRLTDGRYVLEREMGRGLGFDFNHPAGDLIFGLMEYYRQNYLHVPPHEVSFSRFLEELSEVEMRTIWKLQAPPNADQERLDESQRTFDETVRRFHQGVRMLSPEKRARYRVEVKNGLLYWDKWGDSKPLDTTPTGGFFDRKHQHPVGESDTHAIWVLSKDQVLYTHASKLYRFHHSSFTAGDYILCAGEWSVFKGKLEWISGRSGHYRPTHGHLKNAVQVLANRLGIPATSYRVLCKGQDNREVPVPASTWLHESVNVLESKYKVA